MIHPLWVTLGRMSLHLSPPLVSTHLSPTPRGRMFYTCLPLSLTLGKPWGQVWEHEFTLVFHLSPTLVSHSGCLGPHEFTLGSSHLSPSLGVLGRMIFRLVSHLSPTLVSHTCLPHLSPTLGALGRMSLHLSPTCPSHLSLTLGVLGRMILHLSPTCSPNRFTLVLLTLGASLGRMSLPLSPSLSPTLGALGRMSLHLFSTCLSHLSPTLGALGRMSLHLSPHLSPTLAFHTCLALWVPWAA